MLAQLTSNTAPDVFYVGDDKIGQFVDSKRLMPLGELMESKESKTKKDDFFPRPLRSGRARRRGVRRPNDSNPDVFWYDKKALEAAGITEDPATLAESGEWTTDKFLEMNEKLHDAGLTGTMYWNYWATHWSWLSSQGLDAPLWTSPGAFGRPTRTPETVESVQQLGRSVSRTARSFVAGLPARRRGCRQWSFVTHEGGLLRAGSLHDPARVDATGEQGQLRHRAVADRPDGEAAPTGVATELPRDQRPGPRA
ncbi:extracellular solute-binding protein [Microbacterium hydrocarbonoxydans]|uniref:extracellular solute-binding protein n=1 Tax=Microbacterium hydrocarbonoxydans TaxID=273678 RepID=UPI0009F62449